MIWVKICGTTSLEDAKAAVEAGADAVGFVFAPSERRISPKEAVKIIAQLPEKVEKVGVFVNQSGDIVLETVEKVGLTGVQLHGDEDAEFIRGLAGRAGKLRIYKAIAMEMLAGNGGAGVVRGVGELGEGDGVLAALFVDSGVPGKRGGTGKSFDWEDAAPLVRFLKTRHKIVVAGGLNPGNVARAVELFRPWGVDVVSGVESEPGKKDHAKLRAFVAAVRDAQAKN